MLDYVDMNIQLGPVIAGGGQGLHERRKAGNPHVRGGRQAPRVQQGHRACRGNCQVGTRVLQVRIRDGLDMTPCLILSILRG